MANPEHLEILRRGVGDWNTWRRKNLGVEPDLVGADLKDNDLEGFNFRNAHLGGADLRDTYLGEADLRAAKLERANLEGANVEEADFRGANLKGADLRNTQNLKKANFEGVNLEEANLTGVVLKGANIQRVILKGANLKEANLEEVILKEANLEGANLEGANLRAIQALGINFKAAILTGACIEDWNINAETNLENVTCNYIFLKLTWEPKNRVFKFIERRPNNPENQFASRDFEQLVKNSQEAVDLVFRKGINVQTLLNDCKQFRKEALSYKEQRGWNPTTLNFTAQYNQEVNAMAANKSNDNSIQKQGDSIMSGDKDIQIVRGDNNRTAKGDNSTFVQGDNNQMSQGEQVSATEVLEMLAYLEEQIQNLTALPEAEREKSIKRLEAAKVEATESEPNKDSIANSLKRVNETLNEAGETTQEVKELVKELFPTVVKVAGWLGYAAGKIWMM